MTQNVPAWMVEFARCEPFIRAALEYDEGAYNFEDVMLRVANGECQFWPGERSAVVTEVVRYPRKSICNFWLAGGDLEELERMSHEIEKWAREQGCDCITLTGRRGWSRTFLTKRGYEPRWTVMSKEL